MYECIHVHIVYASIYGVVARFHSTRPLVTEHKSSVAWPSRHAGSACLQGPPELLLDGSDPNCLLQA